VWNRGCVKNLHLEESCHWNVAGTGGKRRRQAATSVQYSGDELNKLNNRSLARRHSSPVVSVFHLQSTCNFYAIVFI